MHFLTLIAFFPARFKSLYQYHHAQGHILTHDVNGIQGDYTHLLSTVMRKEIICTYSGHSIHFIELIVSMESSLSGKTCFASEY